MLRNISALPGRSLLGRSPSGSSFWARFGCGAALVWCVACAPTPAGPAAARSASAEPPGEPPAEPKEPSTSKAQGKKAAPAKASDDLAKRFDGKPALTTLSGEASYYADSLAGNSTASGEPYRPHLHSAAHRKLPFGTVVRVVRKDTGATTYAVVNDRGPFGGRGRIIDLSRAAAKDLDMIRAGVVSVRVEVVQRP